MGRKTTYVHSRRFFARDPCFAMEKPGNASRISYLCKFLRDPNAGSQNLRLCLAVIRSQAFKRLCSYRQRIPLCRRVKHRFASLVMRVFDVVYVCLCCVVFFCFFISLIPQGARREEAARARGEGGHQGGQAARQAPSSRRDQEHACRGKTETDVHAS